MKSQHQLRLEDLRIAMQAYHIDAWLLPSSDPHSSEYLPSHWQGRSWLSGFDGSVGTLAITSNKATLWVDSRYWLQAENQLEGSGIELMKVKPGETDAPIRWLIEQLNPGGQLGFDADIVTLETARKLYTAAVEKHIVINSSSDLLDQVWSDRPALPHGCVYAHPDAYLGDTVKNRLDRIRKEMAKKGADYHVISTLDDIAWITQLRGSDVEYNPLFIAHMLITKTEAFLFVDSERLDSNARNRMSNNGISVESYSSWKRHLNLIPENNKILLDPAKVTLATCQSLPKGSIFTEVYLPSSLAKSLKNDTEINHIRTTMEEDGAALCEFFAWLEKSLNDSIFIDEKVVADQLLQARAKRNGFISPSFGTMCGFNKNAAQPHYQPTAASSTEIKGDGLLLIDSGAHYYGGTTDITRMVAVGQISREQREDISYIFKGLVALTNFSFPRNLPSPLLDTIARAPLWNSYRDYGHGTGHGVGYFLNVHEGPQSFAWYTSPTPQTQMQPGMITSIEPGCYRPNKWGARLENLVVCKEAQGNDFNNFLNFETLTLCPFDTRCFDFKLLENHEIDWLNSYHSRVFERLSHLVSGDALHWLKEKTQPIKKIS